MLYSANASIKTPITVERAPLRTLIPTCAIASSILPCLVFALDSMNANVVYVVTDTLMPVPRITVTKLLVTSKKTVSLTIYRRNCI